jgi:hypothetical protein
MEAAQMKMQSQVLGMRGQSGMNAAQAIQPGSIYALSANSAVSNTVTIQSDTMTLGGETIDKSLIQKLKELVK